MNSGLAFDVPPSFQAYFSTNMHYQTSPPFESPQPLYEQLYEAPQQFYEAPQQLYGAPQQLYEAPQRLNETHQQTQSLQVPQQPQNADGQEERFVKNEKVLVFHGAMLYEATVMRVNESRPRKPYFIKFTGFGSKYNTWAGSDILIKDLPENRLYQEELKANLQQSMILKNIGKNGNSVPAEVPIGSPVATFTSVPISPAFMSSSSSFPTSPLPQSFPSSSCASLSSLSPPPFVASSLASLPSPIVADKNPQEIADEPLPDSLQPTPSSESLDIHGDSEATETDSEEEALDQVLQRFQSDTTQKSTTKSTAQKSLSTGVPSQRDKKKKKEAKREKVASSGKTKPKDELRSPKSHKKKKPLSALEPVVEPKLYCVCKKPEVWPMIGCDVCSDWFHLSCVGLTPSETDHMDTYACPACATKSEG